MARYLITGGAGFIGSHLAQALLAGGDDVIILDDLSTGDRARVPTGAELIVGDVCDQWLMRRAVRGVDGVFHLAAIASVPRCNEAWVSSHQTNLTGAITAFEMARQVGAPVVYASSSAVYGDVKVRPIAETAPTQPITAYGADKLGCELHAAPAARIHGVSSTGLRLFNVYGPGQDPGSPYAGVITIFAQRLRAELPITVYGDGQQTRDFIHVSDVVTAFIAAMLRLRARIEGEAAPIADALNVCTGEATSVNALIGALAEVLGVTPEIVERPARPGDIRHSVGDATLLHKTLGLSTGRQLLEGLQQFLAHAGIGPETPKTFVLDADTVAAHPGRFAPDRPGQRLH